MATQINTTTWAGEVLNYLKYGDSPIALADLRNFFRHKNPDISDSTVNWRVHELVRKGQLKRIGQGKFTLSDRAVYVPAFTPFENNITQAIQQMFPQISFCVWSASLLNEFSHHLFGYPFIFVDVEKDAADAVYFHLKGDFKPVFYQLSSVQINQILPDFDDPMLVRTLPTESPVNVIDGTPRVTLEKILVDIFADAEFSFIGTKERKVIYGNAFDRYIINESRLLRYASRKGKRAELSAYIQSNNFTNP